MKEQVNVRHMGGQMRHERTRLHPVLDCADAGWRAWGGGRRGGGWGARGRRAARGSASTRRSEQATNASLCRELGAAARGSGVARRCAWRWEVSLWRWEVSLWRVSLGRVALGESLDLRIVPLHLQPVVEASVHRARPTSSHDTHLCVDVDVLLVLVVPAMRPGHIIILILRLEVDKLHRQRAPPPQPPRHKGTQAGSEACVRDAGRTALPTKHHARVLGEKKA